MFPHFAPTHAADGFGSHAKALGYCDPRFSGHPYFSNDVCRQFHAVVSFTYHAIPAFSQHVAHVIEMGAKKQMCDVDASGIIAAVEHKQAVGNESVSYFPCSAMRQDWPFTSLVYFPVATAIYRSRPQPAGARIGFEHKTRKSFGEWYKLWASHGDFLHRVVRAVTMLNTPWRPVHYSAVFAR